MLSFGVLIVFLSPKQSKIKESSLESMAKDFRTVRLDTPLESGRMWVVARLAHFSQCFPSEHHIRIGYVIIQREQDSKARMSSWENLDGVDPDSLAARGHFISRISCADILHPDIS